MNDRAEDLKELLKGLKDVKIQAAEIQATYETVKGLKKLTNTMPQCDSRTSLINQTAQLEIEAMLNEAGLHKKKEKLADLQKHLAESYKSWFVRDVKDEVEFREKMLGTNPEYYYHESLGVLHEIRSKIGNTSYEV